MNKDDAIGVYYGEVVDVLDPLKLGRIKVRTAHYIGSSSASIPWAMYGGGGGGGSYNTGFYFMPDIGAQVLVAFVQGSVEHPVWLGGVPGNDPITGKADTHVSTLDPLRPYGDQGVENWDYTLFNSISTTAGHRIVLDDNLPLNEAGEEVNARRILMESASGNFFRMIEAKTLAPGQEDPLIELATVREDRTWIRRIALDNEDETITITGPDTQDDGQHEFEINSAEDYVSITTSRDYTFLMDDKRELIDLHTSRPGGDIGNQLIFDNPSQTINLKSFEDQSGMTIVDGPDGFANLYMPHGVDAQASNATIGIQYNGGSPEAYMVNGTGLGQNGFTAHADGARSSMWSGGSPGASSPGPAGSDVQIFVDGPASTVFAGQTSTHYLKMEPGSSKLYHANSVEVVAAVVSIGSVLTGITTITGGQGLASMSLAGAAIIMTGGSGISHDYFNHVHAVNALGGVAGDPYATVMAGVNSSAPAFMISPAGGGAIWGVVATSAPGP